MSVYQGLSITIEGQGLSCTTNFTLSENLEAVENIQGSQFWARYVGNLQGFSISLSGIDQGAYAYLRNFKRIFARISWQITGGPSTIQGFGYIETLERSSPEGGDLSYSAEITGYGNII